MPAAADLPPSLAPTEPASDPLALYVHWPFCAAKCPYCDFNSHVRERVDGMRYGEALRRELAHEAARLAQQGQERRKLASIFFGGGTPSLMPTQAVADIIADACRFFDPTPDIEITLEANPTSVEIAKLAELRAAGVNRASLGVQALNNQALGFLGRKHDAGQAIAALEAARSLFPRLSFDLIYARPGQQEAEWRAELRQALTLAADHLSLYQLTIEPGTRFATEHARGAFALPEGEEAAALYFATGEEAGHFGLLPYEVSNYARPGAESRHNLAYWRYGDYLGIGAGAHQRLLLREGLVASRRHRGPEEWLARVEAQGHAITHAETLSATDRAREAMLMGLRLSEGVDPARIEARTGLTLAEAVDPGILAACLEEDYLRWTADGRLAATWEGRLRLDALLPALLR
ncbi:radical SAM family heme chaperone HemW [Roseomonas sp. USHLN139]|uniref:radical SAM family heme chaperone HemW n=1 Tax=Roseomonas sp. USHLN139 TaxID=3081298 RepID=UPI003B01A899